MSACSSCKTEHLNINADEIAVINPFATTAKVAA